MPEPRRILMPRIDPSSESATIVQWLKNKGDKISKGEAVAVAEGEKTTVEIESEFDGIMRQIFHAVGDEVRVAEPIAEIESEDVVISPSRVETKRKPTEEAFAQEPVIGEKEIEVELTGIRKTIAERLSQSFHTSVPVTLTSEFDATRLIDSHEHFKRTLGKKAPSMTSIIISICASVLRENPQFNVVVEEDKMRIKNSVNISVAVDTPSGLFAPVIKDADKLTPQQIEIILTELREKAMNERLSYEEQHGHTFTITNLGTDGVLFFTPVLNPPSLSILGIGEIIKKPVAIENDIRVRSVGHLSLVFDHRFIDGAPTARFLSKVKKAMEDFQP